jgi:hypothetical protein
MLFKKYATKIWGASLIHYEVGNTSPSKCRMNYHNFFFLSSHDHAPSDELQHCSVPVEVDLFGARHMFW